MPDSFPTSQFRPLIRAAADLAGLPSWRWSSAAIWLEGLILQESGGDPRARRYERHQDTPERASREHDPDSPALDDGELEDDASYGLMQVMGYNARALVGAPPGTPLNFGFLFRPITNIGFGLRILLGELKAVDGDISRALARYNGGTTGDDRPFTGAPMRCQAYVDGVDLWARRVAREVNG